jgi:hypothetical protein
VPDFAAGMTSLGLFGFFLFLFFGVWLGCVR